MGRELWRLMIAAALEGILLFHGFCFASKQPRNYTFMHEAVNAPKTSYYDYIIIGGGTAGCPLAATLSQKYSVLLLERGGSPYGNPDITKLANIGSPLLDFSLNSPAQLFVSEDGIINARASVLGGGTSINAGFYSRAEADFFKNVGLSMDEGLMNRAYKWVEKSIVFKKKLTPLQSTVRDALLEVGVVPYNNFTYQHIVGTKVSGTIFDKKGSRHTAADLLRHANPTKLSLFLQAYVQNILFRNKEKSKPTAYGVVFKDVLGKKHMAYLKGQHDEIILCAGAIGSPHLLMLSGIGPEDQLNAQKIKVVLDQPLVGQGMADNPMSAVFVPSPNLVELSTLQVAGITSFGSYIEAGSGFNFLGGSPEDYQGFSYKKGAYIAEKVNGPLSKGYMKILSRDPNDNPSVKFNYFKEPIDLKKCVHGVATISNVIDSKAFSNFKYSNMTSQDVLNLTVKLPTNLPIHPNTSTSLEQFCKDTVRTMYHFHGGCQVGKVVDHDYKVLGVEGLRVIDGSTFLYSPGTNPQATVLMLGRYMGVVMAKQRHYSENSK